jgi:IS1 family transposase
LTVNRLSLAERATVVRALVEGGSIRSVSRMTGIAVTTILRLIEDVGEFCEFYHNVTMRRLKVQRVEADEIWGFVGSKQRNATKPGQGDLWTYTAIDADTKLMFSWLIGPRSKFATRAFVTDMASRIEGRFQLTTDGLYWYEKAVRAAAYGRVDYAQVVKSFASTMDERNPARRYSPASVTSIIKQRMMGSPDMDLASTSYVERNNLQIRQSMKRMARLTLGFSKSARHHHYAFAIHSMHFNFCRAHGTLTKAANGKKTTPAMAAGLVRQPWTVEQMLQRMDAIFVL